MTEQDPAITAADTLALRLILSMLNDDYDMTNKTLRDIAATVAGHPRAVSLVCCSLAVHSISALRAIGNEFGDSDFGIRMVEGWLAKALDAAG